MYDAASSILAQKISQVSGVGQVRWVAARCPAVRVELNPDAVNKYDIGIDQVATALARQRQPAQGRALAAAARWQLSTTDQLFKANEYRPLVVAYHNGAPVRVADIGEVTIRGRHPQRRLCNGKPAMCSSSSASPAPTSSTPWTASALLPQLQASIPPSINLRVALDRTTTIRASVHDVEITLLISVVLVILVVFVFLRNARATFIPSVAVPISLMGTFGVMYLVGYSLDNLSLMALTISTGFVVDDAIVVIENITRYLEQGMKPMQAALKGAAEIGFTVVSMSISLIAVFIPHSADGRHRRPAVPRIRHGAVVRHRGFHGRLADHHAHDVRASAEIARSSKHGRIYNCTEAVFNWILESYASRLARRAAPSRRHHVALLATISVTVYLYIIVPKGFFPEQDTGRMSGSVMAEQTISFQAMVPKLQIAGQDRRSTIRTSMSTNWSVGGSYGGGTNTAHMFVVLRPIGIRKVDRRRSDRAHSAQDGRPPRRAAVLHSVAGHPRRRPQSSAAYQFTLQGQDLDALKYWAPIVSST